MEFLRTSCWLVTTLVVTACAQRSPLTWPDPLRANVFSLTHIIRYKFAFLFIYSSFNAIVDPFRPFVVESPLYWFHVHEKILLSFFPNTVELEFRIESMSTRSRNVSQNSYQRKSQSQMIKRVTGCTITTANRQKYNTGTPLN